MSSSRQRVLLQTLCLLVGILCLNTSHAAVIDLPGLGQIDGTTTQSHWTGRTIYQYKGIPFAEPPVGDLRFKRPVKFATSWDGILQCDDFGPVCPQGTGFLERFDLNLEKEKPKAYEQSEDCLTINVFSNKLTDGGVGTGNPVMVFVHGGAFVLGSARSHDPVYLLEKDVVLATVQYRLGPFGFLSLKNEEIPGNQGMLDVVLALEWVRDNIEHFGGDPSRVTVFGQSAGAAAVTSLLFSPLAEGLFHRVIGQSGALLGTWALDADPVPKGTAIARLALCFQNDVAALAECLRGKTTNQILAAHTAYLVQDVIGGGRALGGHNMVWNEAGANSYMRKDPAEMLRNGEFKHIPMIAGVTKHEGTGFLAIGYDLIFTPFDLHTNEEYLSRRMVKFILDCEGIEDQTGYTRSLTRDKYFPNGELGNFTQMIPGLVDIIGVGFLKATTITVAAEMSLYAPTYFYTFNFHGRHSTFPSGDHYPFEGGINHSDDLFYLFQIGRELNEEEDLMAQQMVELWTNFAHSRTPTAAGVPEWPPLSSAVGPYMVFDSTHRVQQDFINDQYMIAIKEGLSPPTDPNESTTPAPPTTTTQTTTPTTTPTTTTPTTTTPTTTTPTTTTPTTTTPTTTAATPGPTDDPGAATSVSVSIVTLIVVMLWHIIQ